jgi:hypothetical protein
MLSVNRTIRENLLIMRDAIALAQHNHEDALTKAYNDKFESHFRKAYSTYKLLN